MSTPKQMQDAFEAFLEADETANESAEEFDFNANPFDQMSAEERDREMMRDLDAVEEADGLPINWPRVYSMADGVHSIHYDD